MIEGKSNVFNFKFKLLDDIARTYYNRISIRQAIMIFKWTEKFLASFWYPSKFMERMIKVNRSNKQK